MVLESVNVAKWIKATVQKDTVVIHLIAAITLRGLEVAEIRNDRDNFVFAISADPLEANKLVLQGVPLFTNRCRDKLFAKLNRLL